ncbi:MAG: sortase [Frankiaceae bacterium]|jgi:sortase A|nr:sortase [Frankiaceae bacterium]
MSTITAVATDRAVGRRQARVRRERAALHPGAAATIAAASAVGLLAAWVLGMALVGTSLTERSAQARLYATFRAQLAAETAPLGGPIAVGAPVAMLDSAALHLHHVVVVEGTAASQLASGPGHRPDSPLPGQAGWSVVYGRSLTFGAPFRSIATVPAGSTLTVTTGQGVFDYRVVGVRRGGIDSGTFAPSTARLTLVTSGESVANPAHAVYVDAVLAHGSPQPAPAGRPTTVAAADVAMRGDSTQLTPLVFWLEALVGVAFASVWAARRWGRWQTWVVSAPLAVAALWGATGSMLRLLPNLI